MHNNDIVKNAPAGATHYSPYRNIYYRLVDDVLYEQWITNGNWDVSPDSINLNKWVDLYNDWNDGYWTEGMDRVHTLMVMTEQLLGDEHTGYHPAITRAHCEKKVSKIVSKIAKLYQQLGAAAWKDED